MKYLKYKFFFFFLFLFSFLWLTVGRPIKVKLGIDSGKLTVWEGQKPLAELEENINRFSSLALNLDNDQDSFWVLPFKKQKIEVIYQNNNSQLFFLTNPKDFTLANYFKSQFSFSRQPWAAKIFFNDHGPKFNQQFKLKNFPVKKIIFYAWNLNEAELTLKTSSQKTLVLWMRPKFHHDGNLNFDGRVIAFQNPVNNSSVYYLSTLISILAKTFIGVFLILGFTLLLIKILPKKTVALSFFSDNFQTIAVLIYVFVFVATALLSIAVLEKIPHSQDEAAYFFQAQIFSRGKLFLESLPGNLRRFFDQEFIVNNGKWYSAFPPGTSFILSLGVIFNRPHLVNPIISLFNVYLFLLLAKQITSKTLAIFASLLFVVSPFFLLISASFLSHPSALFFTLLATYTYTKIDQKPAKTFFWLLLGFALGFLLLIRPQNAFLLGLLFFILLFKQGLKNIYPAIGGGALVGLFVLINAYYNFKLTGNPLVLPHNVYSPFNQLGFGMRGVEWGAAFTLTDAFKNLTFNACSLLDMLYRWPAFFTFSFIPFIFVGKFRKKAFLLISLFIAQVVLYFVYFNEGTFMGPRFWFEVSWIIPLLTVMGAESIVDFFPQKKFRMARFSPFLILFILFIYGAVSTFMIIPSFKGFNGIESVKIPPLKTPAVVFVPSIGSWNAYGRFFIKQNPFLDEPVIFTRDQGINNVTNNLPPLPNDLLKTFFPNRHFYLYQEGQFLKL